MATNGVVASGIAQHTLQRLEHIVGKLQQVPVPVWRRVCLAALLLWLCYSLSQLFWLVMPRPEISAPALTAPSNAAFAERSTNAAGSQVDINALKELSLFGSGSGEAPEVVVSAPDIEEEAVETSLRLTLFGAIPSSDPQRAKAIIGDGGKQAGFNPGDELDMGPRGVKLAKVMHDRVIIDNNGRYETLWLYDERNRPAASAQRNTRTAGATAQRPSRRAQSSASSQSQPASGEDGNEARDLVAAVMPEGDQQLPSEDQVRMVTDVMNVSMHREGGQLIGFRIRPKGDRELFDQLGLQPNDVVTAVNNIGLDDTSRAMEVYRSLGQESRATLEILRDGTTITVDVALDQQ